jgi:hypothetical protein
VRFEIACATVDPQTTSFDPSPLIPYVQSLGITYHYLSEPIVELAKQKLKVQPCSRWINIAFFFVLPGILTFAVGLGKPFQSIIRE